MIKREAKTKNKWIVYQKVKDSTIAKSFVNLMYIYIYVHETRSNEMNCVLWKQGDSTISQKKKAFVNLMYGHQTKKSKHKTNVQYGARDFDNRQKLCELSSMDDNKNVKLGLENQTFVKLES